MIIPMVIIDMVNSLKADGFSFNLIMKSVDDNSEPFVMGTMGLEDVNNVIQRDFSGLWVSGAVSLWTNK